MSGDPSMDGSWVGFHQFLRAGRTDNPGAGVVVFPSSLESEHGPRGGADAIKRYDAKYHGAGRDACSVNDDRLARAAYLLESIAVVYHLATIIVLDQDRGKSWCDQKRCRNDARSKDARSHVFSLRTK